MVDGIKHFPKMVIFGTCVDADSNGQQNSYDACHTRIKFKHASGVSIAGIKVPSIKGGELEIYNKTGTTLSLLNESGDASETERILTNDGTINIQDGCLRRLFYDVDASRWVLVV
jgi:hypothetical protein